MATANCIQDLRVPTWREFKAAAFEKLYPPKGKFSQGDWLFRGQGDSAWPLETSFDRWYREMRATEPRLPLAESLLTAFRAERALVSSQIAAAESEIDEMALAQHYGVPTRLLDWTDSPYIAAYFAFEQALRPTSSRNGDVAIMALRANDDFWKQGYGITIVRATVKGNERLQNQFGAFTLNQTMHGDLVEALAQCTHCRLGLLTRFSVPASEAPVALADLASMGIGPRRLFLGLEGAAREVMQRFDLKLRF